MKHTPVEILLASDVLQRFTLGSPVYAVSKTLQFIFAQLMFAVAYEERSIFSNRVCEERGGLTTCFRNAGVSQDLRCFGEDVCNGVTHSCFQLLRPKLIMAPQPY